MVTSLLGFMIANYSMKQYRGKEIKNNGKTIFVKILWQRGGGSGFVCKKIHISG
jgi:hypothetical protein